MTEKEYSVPEIKTLLDSMSGMYDLARVVDPVECRILDFHESGDITMKDKCYGIWNSDQKCVNCSSSVACKTGCHQEKAEHFNDNVYHIQSNPVKIKLADGGVFSAVVELVSIEEGGGNDGSINDRVAENEEDKALRFHAMHDSLTGTLKSDVFYEKARELLAKDQNAAWTMITGDIMEFRLFNTLFGDERSNEALIKTAEALEKIALKGGGLCSRLYRDKFAVLLPTKKYREGDLTAAANDIKNALSNGIYTLCVHFGVYEIENPEIPVSVMCDRAAMALKTIKKDVSRTVAYFDGEIMKKSLIKHEIISGFREALRKGQFKMHLQPLTNADGTPFGAEALARWERPDGSVVAPSVFIETLEDAGLIQELDRNIWEQAAKQLSLWKDTKRADLSISVNMSAKDFYSMDIVTILTDLTARYGVENNKLRLEITESALIDPERSAAVIEKLQSEGFLVEIDDFGKGHSSLSLLKDIKADILKIDMGFVRETENAKRSQIILRTVTAMAKELGMQVITEGVETEKQLRALSDMGCTHFQGYYFSPPVTVGEFEAKYN